MDINEVLNIMRIKRYLTSTLSNKSILEDCGVDSIDGSGESGGESRSFITTTPADANVSLIWSATKPGYVPQSGKLTLTDDSSVNVSLTQISNYSTQPFTINVLSSGTVIINTTYWGNSESEGCYSLNGRSAEYLVLSDRYGYSSDHYNLNYLKYGQYDLTLNVNAGDCIKIWGTGFTPNNDDHYDYDSSYSYGFIGGTANIEVCGNLLSLTLDTNFSNGMGNADHLEYQEQFKALFKDNTHLISAQNLILPSITSYGCYESMFKGCTSLTTAPSLPAYSLSDSCYANMFKGCTSLTTAPDLLSDTYLPSSCYSEMFYGCSNLNYIKCLATTDEYSSGSLGNWTYGVAANGTFIKLDQTNWPIGTSGIPTGWVTRNDNDHEFVINPTPADATVIIDGEARTSKWTKTGSSIAWSVYKPGYVPQTGTYTMTNQDYTMDISLVASTDNYTFTINPTPADATVTINDVSTSSVTVPIATPISWSVNKEGYTEQSGSFIITENTTESVILEEIPAFEATPLTVKALESGDIVLSVDGWQNNSAQGWYKVNNGSWTAYSSQVTINVQENDTIQFKGINWRLDAESGGSPLLAYGTTADHEVYGNVLSLLLEDNFVGQTPQLDQFRFFGLFDGDEHLISAENLILPTANLGMQCYANMFQNCSSLTKGPDLLAESLNDGTEYDYMFGGCSSLNYIKCLLTGSNISCSNWVTDVAANGTFVKSADATWETGDRGIPSGWTVVNA